MALSLTAYRERYPERAEAMARAYLSGAYTMAEIGAHFGVHYMTVSRAVKRFEHTRAMTRRLSMLEYGARRQEEWYARRHE